MGLAGREINMRRNLRGKDQGLKIERRRRIPGTSHAATQPKKGMWNKDKSPEAKGRWDNLS